MIDKPLLCMDWDTRTLRVVQSRIKRQNVTVDQALSIAIPSDVRVDDPESMGTFIAQALAKAGISTKRVVVDIPRELINYYALKLPTASVDDLAGMVAFQIPKELPFPVDQAVVDFTVPEASDGEPHDVMVAAVRKETLAARLQILEQAGLKPQRVGLRPNACQFAVNALLDPTPHDLVLFVDVGPETTEIDVILQGRLVFSRAADVAIPEILDTPLSDSTIAHLSETKGLSLVSPPDRGPSTLDRVVRELMIEVTRSIEAYRVASPGAVIEHAVIGGSCDIEEALADAVQKKYNITAQPYNPATCFGWDADRGAAAGAFAATLGLALSYAGDPTRVFDFLSPKKSVSRAQRQIKKAPMAAAAALVFLAAGVAFYVKAVKPEYEARDLLRAEIEELEEDLDRQAEFKNLVEVMQEYEEQQIVWLDELRDVVTVLPVQKQFALTSLNFSQKEHRIKAPFRATGAAVGSDTVDALEGFRPSGSDQQQFTASLGMSSVKPKEDYKHSGSLEISIVDRRWADEKKKRR